MQGKKTHNCENVRVKTPGRDEPRGLLEFKGSCRAGGKGG